MVNIYLTGKLGRLFGKVWRLDVRSPAEAIRAIDINLRGKLCEYLRGEGAQRYYKVAVQKKENTLYKEEYFNPSGCGDIYIMPTIRGAEKGWQKLVVGVILAIVTYGVSAYASAAVAAAGGTASASASAVFFSSTAFTFTAYSAAASLIIGGVTQMLTPVPRFNDGTSADSKASFIFPGNSTTIQQGVGVPIPYGRVMISPMPISISSSTFDQRSTPAEEAETSQEELSGGGYQ